MPRIQRSALVPFDAGQMFALVDDVAAYPDFLPWCHESVVHERTATMVRASLTVGAEGLRKTFSTINHNQPPGRIDIELDEGPFERLAGGWQLEDLGDSGCKISFKLEFEFSSATLSLMFGGYFEKICNSLVDAFTERAREIYGQQSGSSGER